MLLSDMLLGHLTLCPEVTGETETLPVVWRSRAQAVIIGTPGSAAV